MYGIGAFEHINVTSNIIEEVKKMYSNFYTNGGVIIECFEVRNESVFQNLPFMEDEYKDFFVNMLSSKDLVNALPELKLNTVHKNHIKMDMISPFIFDGEIAGTLFNGGAYKSFWGTPKEAKNIAMRFSEYILEDRYTDVVIYNSYTAWSDWYFDVAWDYTWMIFDEPKKRFWIICLTDTD